MKKASFYLLLFVIMFPLGGCDKTDDGTFTEPITIYEKINGVWNLSSLRYIDEFAKANNIEPNEDLLTSWFNFSDFKLTLNVDANNQPLDFKVTGDVPELFPASGYWQLSSAFPLTTMKPVVVGLYADASKSTLIGELQLISIPGANAEMELQLVRTTNGVAYASYVFKLLPAN